MQAKLVSQTPPTYPPQARAAGITGSVRLYILIAADGTVKQINVTSGQALLVPAAIEAVRHWTYQPSLLNSAPVEVATAVTVTFGN